MELSPSLSWDQKPYHALDYELKRRFGEKLYKLSLNAGMTCPNRDGTLGRRGCLFCSEGGSGEFAGKSTLSITGQLEQQKALLESKRPAGSYIAYFQAYTNTYAPVSRLRDVFTEALCWPHTSVLSIATRPDCLPAEVLDLLEELAGIKPVWVELGLQTIHPRTAALIRRGYDLPVFEEAVRHLRERGLEVIVHTILGLPGETPEDMYATMSYLNRQDIQGIKLQLLHILEGTDLAALYRREPFHVLSAEEYTDLVIGCLERLSPDIVIHRLTGDGPKDLLITPLWSSAKRTVLNRIHHQMKLRESWQGKRYLP